MFNLEVTPSKRRSISLESESYTEKVRNGRIGAIVAKRRWWKGCG
jgi:hypothetical protein